MRQYLRLKQMKDGVLEPAPGDSESLGAAVSKAEALAGKTRQPVYIYERSTRALLRTIFPPRTPVGAGSVMPGSMRGVRTRVRNDRAESENRNGEPYG